MNKRSLASTIVKTVFILAWVCLWAQPRLLIAQTNGPALTYPKNRYLLVVETSRAMQRRTDSLTQALRELLNSGVAGQARTGDSLGVWTFNEELYTGVLPLQQWSSESQKATIDRVVGFIQAQKFEKHARFDKIVPALDRLAHNSQFITIMLVCSGETDIHGTPFDLRINEFFRTWRLQPQDTGRPFIIALRAQSGGFVDCTMNPFPWPADLPALSKELLTPTRRAPPVIVDARKPATSSVPPLIISGKKHDPALSVAAGDSANSKAPAPAAPAPTNNVSQAVVPGAPPTPGPGTASAPNQQPAPDTNSVVVSAAAPATPSTSSQTNPGLSTDSVPSPATSADHHIGSQTPSAPSIVANQSTAPAPGSAAGDQSASAQVQGHNDTPAVSKAGPPQMAASVPIKHSAYQATLLFTAVVSLLAIGGAVWLWRVRARRTKDTSLITESLDRRKD